MRRALLAITLVGSACFGWAESLSRREKETLVSEGDALYKGGQFSAARDKFQAALAGGPSRAESRRWRPLVGRTFEAEGNYQKALTVYQEAFDGDPKNVDRWIDLARLYDAVEIDDQAVRFYAEANKKDTTRRDVALALAALYAQSGRLAEAKTLAVQAVRTEPRDYSAQELLADIEERSGDLAGAARRRETAVSLRSSAEGYMKLGRLWARQDVFDMADAAFVRAGQAGDSGPEPSFERAVLAWRQGQIDRARDLLADAEKRAPGYFPAGFLRRWMDIQSRGARAVSVTGLSPGDPDCARWAGVLESAGSPSRKGKP
ncbi:MAG: tetratricopeptide repeat protein [Elusimicrobia bacterium]|nr:tetratricopeptide repeat protein [Elusimicrobiota bacterium]